MPIYEFHVRHGFRRLLPPPPASAIVDAGYLLRARSAEDEFTRAEAFIAIPFC